ncbi:alpha/beta fold hydrolase [Luteimicrobium sp. NPDC057192]|uniref:alpha/beta fold hydrolase n=1 Tax=Luteimicrobium sp. NPDC057192 TaxID=3346042 RepID=UPI00363BF52D
MSAHVLAATTSGDEDGPPVVLLHGILGSAAYWEAVTRRLPDRRTIALDLLGFGASPRPTGSAYDTADHVAAVVATLDALDLRAPVTLVGHSMGALVALRLAADHPDRVARLVLVGMPVFASPEAARRSLARTPLRRALLYGPTSRALCLVWCRALRPLSRRVAALYVRRVPAAVGRATVDHSWRSYSRSLAGVVENQTASADLARTRCPVVVVRGDRDPDAHLPAGADALPGVRDVLVPAWHQVPIERPDVVADAVRGSQSAYCLARAADC